MKRRIRNIVIIAALLGGLLYSCSTEKNTAIRRAYHNLTAYFNALYNAQDAFKSGENRLMDEPNDNYARMLNIFYYSNDGAATVVNSDMGRVQEKASKVVKKHSITARPEKRKRKNREFNDLPEYCKHVDDAYLLKGKAELYKHEYFQAIETFRFIIREYSMMPIKYDGQLWLTRTYLEMNKFNRAKELIELMQGDNQFPKRLDKALYLTVAEYHKKQYEFKEAAKQLEKAIPLTKDKTKKYRYHYILAQIYQELQNNDKANENYAIVMRKNPIYEMVFNARINMAQLYRTTQGSAEDLQKELKKMLKDDKNKEYQDQIYFALGSIEENKNNIPEALKYYRKSAAVSVQNNYQKTESYLAVADIYFEQPDYKNAQMYYDSAMGFIDKKRRNYKEIYNKSQNLNELVTHITTIEHQDSLQRVAAMGESERLALIDQIIEDLIEEEKRQMEEERMNRLAMQNQQQDTRQRQGGGWYFYNPTAVSMGENSFKQKWGQRELEDNWRRSNKSQMTSEPMAENTQGEDSTKITDNKKREYYLQNLPLTDSALAVSDSLIQHAYYELGNVYRIKLEDLPKATNTYEELLSRYPGFEKNITVYYRMYKMYDEMREQEEAERYRNIIIQQYPESLYARLMTNPDYIKKIQEKEQQAKFFYRTTWRLFKKGEYQQVINNFRRADTAFAKHKLYSKFALLNTLAKGRMADSATFVAYLNDYITQFPAGNETPYAKDLVRYMTTDQTKPQGVEEKEEEKTIAEETKKEVQVDFKMQERVPHYYVSIVDTRKASANLVKFNISNFNIDYYSILDFKVKDFVFSADYQAITVEPFTTWYNAMNYYESINYIKEVYEDISKKNYIHFVISEENYKKLFETKAASQYMEFFQENYVKRREQASE
ncbi:tol-pal system protein YbgF [Salinivirga cyanobacteriivorans]|uniref:Tol-pal system protein YbgF n=1 Tax=Salinivirga cyanobacteriivorans TaxID=1307839 RepID=A0A0S2HZS5_9BACT|nr:hypothetical protein [Salinivirga cyanobacteriivorans]ALO15556.1 tol-pal system protein YbgF [Salinivirga cyanobacteriivorans]